MSMKNIKSGFTLFLAVVIVGVLLFIVAGIVNLAVRQSFISTAGRDSQIAFYAADSGLECALFWDIKNPPGGVSAFDISTGSTINCNQDASNPGNQWVVGGSSISVFNITFLPNLWCASVKVTKNTNNTTSIESSGYNTCGSGSPRRVERAIRATY